jgi:CBS domain-containing protein
MIEDRRPVSDVMTRTVTVVRPQARLEVAARLMRETHVSGLPVVGEDEKLVGILSESDIVRDLDRAVGVASSRGILDLILGSAPVQGESTLDACRHRLARGRVVEVMVRKVVTVGPQDSVAQAARQLSGGRVNRLPVIDERGRVVGIVTSDDLAKGPAGGPSRRRRGSLHPAPVRARARRTHPDPFADI